MAHPKPSCDFSQNVGLTPRCFLHAGSAVVLIAVLVRPFLDVVLLNNPLLPARYGRFLIESPAVTTAATLPNLDGRIKWCGFRGMRIGLRLNDWANEHAGPFRKMALTLQLQRKSTLKDKSQLYSKQFLHSFNMNFQLMFIVKKLACKLCISTVKGSFSCFSGDHFLLRF